MAIMPSTASTDHTVVRLTRILVAMSYVGRRGGAAGAEAMKGGVIPAGDTIGTKETWKRVRTGTGTGKGTGTGTGAAAAAGTRDALVAAAAAAARAAPPG